MQLFVVLITIPWLILLNQTPTYKYVRGGGAIISGIVAMAWIWERVTQMPNFVSAFVNKEAEQAPWAILILAVLALASITLKRRVAHS
jgi:hypothetical protein